MASQSANWTEFQAGGGFIAEPIDSPAAMENEVCVDGKYQVNKKGKKGDKKRVDQNYLRDVCRAFRGMYHSNRHLIFRPR
jgi:hypothetical protein